MDTLWVESVERHFESIGARVRVVDGDRPERGSGHVRRGRRAAAIRRERMRVTLDVRRERRGEWFEIALPPAAPWDLQVLDVRPRLRHLLLMTRDENGAKHRFLCGHDERHWFVAAIPESARGVADVPRALDALKPPAVLDAQARAGVPCRDPQRRRTPAFVRQGEWFFLPAPDLAVEPDEVLRREPFSRGRRSKAHVADECCRTGGELVYVSRTHPRGVTPEEYERLRREDRAKRIRRNWWAQRRNAEMYVRGRIRHADHRTIRLACWHRVLMNTEHRAQAMEQVVFLD